MLSGKVFKFGDDIPTDFIIAGRNRKLSRDINVLSQHTLEDADPTFVKRVKPGDFIVAGRGFAQGSSRQEASLVIKTVGVSAILAQSVGRIFFRNSINAGIPVLICDTEKISDGDMLEVDIEAGTVKDITNGVKVSFAPLSRIMIDILDNGGVVAYIKKYGHFSQSNT
jgi:3-isopropylmalate/(R)-2-methylmalate dehydratase small subunit